MGQERECKLRYGGKTHTGKAYLETDYILFRGGERLKVLLKDLTAVRADRSALRLDFAGGPAELELGDAALKWAQKILHPPSRLDKLGVKPGARIRVIGKLDADFLGEAKAGGAVIGGSPASVVFLAAAKSADLRKIPELAPGAALWVVFPKGVEAFREIEVIEAGRAAGLKDTKVTRFSDTHTALKFQ
jgi:hypothetical protein